MSSKFFEALSYDIETGNKYSRSSRACSSIATPTPAMRAAAAAALAAELDRLVKAQKTKIAASVIFFTIVEVVISFFSIEKLSSGISDIFLVY